MNLSALAFPAAEDLLARQALTMLRNEITNLFAGDRCHCGGEKLRMRALFCDACFALLPRDARKFAKIIFRANERGAVYTPAYVARGWAISYDQARDLISGRRRGEVLAKRKREHDAAEDAA